VRGCIVVVQPMQQANSSETFAPRRENAYIYDIASSRWYVKRNVTRAIPSRSPGADSLRWRRIPSGSGARAGPAADRPRRRMQAAPSSRGGR
jgi:hypothetical protein